MLLIATLDAKSDANIELDCEPLLTTLEQIARGSIPRDEFQKAVKAELRRVHNTAQNRRARRNTRIQAILHGYEP